MTEGQRPSIVASPLRVLIRGRELAEDTVVGGGGRHRVLVS